MSRFAFTLAYLPSQPVWLLDAAWACWGGAWRWARRRMNRIIAARVTTLAKAAVSQPNTKPKLEAVRLPSSGNARGRAQQTPQAAARPVNPQTFLINAFHQMKLKPR
jgi:hypothetical protein